MFASEIVITKRLKLDSLIKIPFSLRLKISARTNNSLNNRKLTVEI